MEILAPAGDWDKLRYAVAYGADAVYTAGREFGLRAKAGNLSNEQLKEAADYCKSHGCRLYVTVNIFAHNRDIDKLPPYISFLQEIGVDAVIVSDPGVVSIVREVAPELAIHLSTQANTTSWKAAEFWQERGVKRIILARELTFREIKEIRARVPGMEFEIFVHGAMCISYSGRCLLSSFLNNRSANLGLCTQPCRWKFDLVEETRPLERFSVEEDNRGTYILNSRDLCLYKHLPEIAASGIDSLKIEGRMKSLYYVANTTRVYKTALRMIQSGMQPPEYLLRELDKISHRHYTTAFFEEFDSTETQYYESSNYIRDYQYIGEIIEGNHSAKRKGGDTGSQFSHLYRVKAKSKFVCGEELEVIYPDYQKDMKFIVDGIYSEEDEILMETKPNSVVYIVTKQELSGNGILRKKIVQ